MKRIPPLRELEKLIGEGGFRSRTSLEEFCIAVGVFHDRRSAKDGKVPHSFDPSRYTIWPMLQMIAHDMDPDVEDMAMVREMLYPYLLGGSELVSETIGRSTGTGALKAISRLIPP
jgi:hypothetical protein